MEFRLLSIIIYYRLYKILLEFLFSEMCVRFSLRD